MQKHLKKSILVVLKRFRIQVTAKQKCHTLCNVKIEVANVIF